MNELDNVSAPVHQPDEAPISTELREHATENLETIKQLIQEARSSGTLSPEDESVLREWLAQDVQAPAQEADQHDAERQSLLASGMVTKAIETVHLGADNSVITPSEHQAELAYRQTHGQPSDETGTKV